MLLILRHTFSSLVPRQSRPLQIVNTTSVTTNFFGNVCSGAAPVRCRHFCHATISQPSIHRVVLHGKSSQHSKLSCFCFEPARVPCLGLATRRDGCLRCEPPMLWARQTGLRIFPQRAPVSSHIDEPLDTGRRVQCPPCTYV